MTAAPAARKERPRLTDAQFIEMMNLVKGSKTVELKLTVPDNARYATLQALEMDPLEAQIRQVVFFDTPDLDLNKAGVVVRARRVQVKGGDTVIKLRPVVPEHVPEEIRSLPDVGVEVDAMPGGYVCSASFKGIANNEDIRAAMSGAFPIRKLFSKQQRAFYAAHAPEGLSLDDLSMLGPIPILKLKFTPRGFNRKMVAELWSYPNGQRLLELSTKCMPNETFQAAAEARAFLVGKGVDLGGIQQTKTRTALDYFSRQLKAAAAD
jgi:hypothetical protein